MIARKTNPAERPAYCLERHYCPRMRGEKCRLGCHWGNFPQKYHRDLLRRYGRGAD